MKKFLTLITVASCGLYAGAQTLDLPFVDSFANATIDETKWEKQTISGTDTQLWVPASQVNNGGTSDSYVPSIDSDGGLVYCHFYSVQRNNDSRLATQPISASSTTSPILDFYLFRSGAGGDAIKIQIQIDDQEWQDIPDAVFNNILGSTADQNNKGWYNYKVGFGTMIPDDCTSYRIGFATVCGYGWDMAVDAVSIYNLAGSDLSVISLSAPETVIAGNDIPLTLTLTNRGSDVKADDYSIIIESDFPQQVLVESVDISSLGTATLNIKVPLTAEEAYDLASYNFTAKIVYEDDENLEDNESDTIEVATAFFDSEAPKNAQGAVVDEETQAITLTWESAKDLSYTPVNVIETFNDLPLDATGDFNGWTSIDLDQVAGSYHYNVGSSEFIVTSGGSPSGGDGKYLGVTSKSGVQQDDWLISPKLNCKEDSEMNFEVRVASKSVSTSTYSIHLELLYSEDEDFDPASPASSFTHSLKSWSSGTYGPLYQNATFCNLSYEGIPPTAKYVALHFDTKTNYDMAMWVDDLKIYENDTNPLLGYHVYERNAGRLNEETLAAETLEYSVNDMARASQQTREFYVTAVYPGGESAPSNLVSVLVTEVEQLLDSGRTIVPVNGGVMVSGYAGENVEVYSFDGQRIASMRCAEVTILNLNAGMYVVKAGNDVSKVMVK